MPLLYAFLTLGLASVICPLLLFIFKYAMKEKTYDERMAEQRKRLAMEHNLKSKPKHQLTKKATKKVEKERTHAEKKSKLISFTNVSGKDIKKIEPSKSNVVPTVDKIDITTSVAKRKIDKPNSKNANSNQSFKPNADYLEENQFSYEDESNNQETNSVISENDDRSSTSDHTACSSNCNISADNVSNGSIGNDETSNSNASSYSSSNENENASNVSEKCLTKNKSSLQDEPSQLDNADVCALKAKNAAAEPQDKLLKKNIKSEENALKHAHKVDEKNKDSKLKQKGDDKVKAEKEKPLKDKPAFTSPSRNKKSSENDGGKFNNDASTPPSCNAQEDVKKKSEIYDSSATISDSNSEKEDGSSSSEKTFSSVAAAKKANGAGVANNGAPKTSLVQPVKNQRQTNNVNKNTKKQATEIKTLQKISSESNGPMNVALLIPLLAKAELSRSEIQNLIDLLLNKQQENGTIDAEWIGSGRQDPMAKMKKQLAEKEKALAAEQEAHQAIQNKLKELRVELNVEKHANRQREETLNSRQTDMQALNARLQAVNEEKQSLAKQIQQLQCKINEERLIARSLKEENSKTKSNLQQELLSQRQQLEMHIAHLNEQQSQAIITLETQLGQLAARLQDQETANAQMNDENVLLRDRVAVQDSQIAHYQQTHPTRQDLMLQLEELRAIKHSSQFEINRLGNEVKSVNEQLSRKTSEVEKYNHIVQNVKIENEELLKENSRINEQIKLTFNEKNQLQIEKEELKKQLIEMHGTSDHNEELRKLNDEVTAYRNMLSEKTYELNRLKEHITQLEASKEDSQSQSSLEHEHIISDLKDKLEKQQVKNNDLRSKNWKAMEALSNMEKTLETKVKGIPRDSPHEIKLKEREAILQRLKVIPNVTDTLPNAPSSYEDNAWFEYLEKTFKNLNRSIDSQSQFVPSFDEHAAVTKDNVLVLDELEKQNRQLQTMVSHYKSIISDTEGMLNSLQKHVEQEENRWSEQVRFLTDQVQEMNEKVQALQLQQNSLAEEQNSLAEERNRLLKGIQNGCAENDVSSTEQKLNNGVDKCMLLANSSISDNTVGIRNC